MGLTRLFLLVGCSIALFGSRELFALDCSENGSATSLSSWQARCTACGGTVVGSGSGMHCSFSGSSAPSTSSGAMEAIAVPIISAAQDLLAAQVRQLFKTKPATDPIAVSVHSEAAQLNVKGMEIFKAWTDDPNIDESEALRLLKRATELDPGNAGFKMDSDLAACVAVNHDGFVQYQLRNFRLAWQYFTSALKYCEPYPQFRFASHVRDNIRAANNALHHEAESKGDELLGEKRFADAVDAYSDAQNNSSGAPAVLNTKLFAAIEGLPAAPVDLNNPIDTSFLRCAKKDDVTVCANRVKALKYCIVTTADGTAIQTECRGPAAVTISAHATQATATAAVQQTTSRQPVAAQTAPEAQAALPDNCVVILNTTTAECEGDRHQGHYCLDRVPGGWGTPHKCE